MRMCLSMYSFADGSVQFTATTVFNFAGRRCSTRAIYSVISYIPSTLIFSSRRIGTDPTKIPVPHSLENLVNNIKTRFVKVPFCKSYKLFNKICMRETGDALDALCKYRKRRQEHTFLPPRFLLPLLFSG